MSLLLNSNVLRKLGTPIRRATPGLYDRLNEVRKRLIVGGDDVAAYHALALKDFAALASVRDKRVLEIGSDLEMRVLKRLVAMGPREVIGVNMLAPAEGRQLGGAKLLRGDAHRLPFDAGSFDYIFSVATFEHIADLALALSEMHRVLAPGGMLFANIGPIWSSGTGHHLDVTVDGERILFSQPKSHPLPDFCHLLMGREGLREALKDRVGPKWIEPMVSWVYDSPDINRLFYRDYVRAFDESAFRLASLVPAKDPIDPQLERVLRFRYPGEDTFDVTNMTAVLMKDR